MLKLMLDQGDIVLLTQDGQPDIHLRVLTTGKRMQLGIDADAAVKIRRIAINPETSFKHRRAEQRPIEDDT